MEWRLATWALVSAATLGCTTTEYTNAQRPDATRADLLSDTQNCQQNNMENLETRGDPYKFPVLVVNQEAAARCLAERGWRPVTK